MLNVLKPVQQVYQVPPRVQEKKFSFGQLPGVKPIASRPPFAYKPAKKVVPNGQYDYFMNSFASVQRQSEPPLRIEPAESPSEHIETKKSREQIT